MADAHGCAQLEVMTSLERDASPSADHAKAQLAEEWLPKSTYHIPLSLTVVYGRQCELG